MRWPAFLLLLLALPALSAPPAAGGDAETKAADADLQKLIDEAIEQGSAWLRRAQLRDGSFPSAYGTAYPMGPTALCTLALLHSGVPRTDPGIVKAFKHLRSSYDRIARAGSQRGLRTYSVSLTVMALARRGWSRGAPGEDGDRDESASPEGFFLEKPDLAWMQEMTSWLVRTQDASGGWRYPEGGYDASNSQYALLALGEAKRAGIRVPRETFEKALRLFLANQESRGKRVPRYEESGGDGVYGATRTRAQGYDEARGWGYVGRSAATPAMTTAGIAALAITRDEVRNARLVEQANQGVRDGIAWLGAGFALTSPGWSFYYIYGLERAGVLARVVYMGRHRWYVEGARHLLRIRSNDGGWSSAPAAGRQLIGSSTATIDTSFALLFLTRATAKSIATPTPPELLNLTEGETLDDGALGDLFAAAFEEMGRLDEGIRGKRARDFAFLGPRVIGQLLPKLSSTDAVVRHRAILILRAITGYRIGYDPEAAEDVREEAAARWTEWYLLHREKLKLDRKARLIG